MPSTLVSRVQQALAAGRPDLAWSALVSDETLPHDQDALQLLVALGLKNGQAKDVFAYLSHAIEINPEQPRLLALYAALLHETGDKQEAARYSARALALDPGNDIAASLLTETLADNLQISAAIRISETCLARGPRAWGVRLARTFAWMAAGEAARALMDAEMARNAVPHSIAARQNSAMASLYLDEPAAETLHRHRSIAGEIPPLKGVAMSARAAYKRGSRPLRIGFVSPDLRRHPVGDFIAPVFAHLDPTRAQAFVYNDAVGDARTQLLRARIAHWLDTRDWTDAKLFQQIQQDQIDVLIDLAGYTKGARPSLFATRCAPVQIGYLGYLHPTCLRAMDALLGDTFTLATASWPGGETPLKLDRHLLCFEPSAHAPPIVVREGGPTRFGSFNHLAKLSPATVRLWARLLKETPGASLTLCALGLGDAGVRHAIQRRFAAEGCDPGRLQLLAPETDPARFLARYGDIDLALDPLPFNGGTTSLQALWQGVPVLTLPGERMAARIGGSLLQALQMEDYIANDEDDYVRIGSRFDAAALSTRVLRNSLRKRMHDAGLTDGRAFTDDMLEVIEAFSTSDS